MPITTQTKETKMETTMNTTETHVADTIIAQLAGHAGRLVAMIGACGIARGSDNIIFKFRARARNQSNVCRITLDADDTYTVSFQSWRGMSKKAKGEFRGVYADQLRPLFEGETGLYLSL